MVQQDMGAGHVRAGLGGAGADFLNSQQAKQSGEIFLSFHGLFLKAEFSADIGAQDRQDGFAIRAGKNNAGNVAVFLA
jgi:hypothetical protein